MGKGDVGRRAKELGMLRCENEVCETGTNLAGIVIASLKRHAGERELKKEEPPARGREGGRTIGPSPISRSNLPDVRGDTSNENRRPFLATVIQF